MYEEFTKEEWKVIPWNSNYLVSNTGKVMSIKDRTNPKILSNRINRHNRCRVQIENEYGELKDFSVHRLVAILFVYNPDPVNYTIIHHIDGNPMNNVYTNLMWCNGKFNARCKRHTDTNISGPEHYASKLNEQQVLEILDLLDKGQMLQKDIAEMYGVCKQTISNIKHGLVYNDITKISLRPLFMETHSGDRPEIYIRPGKAYGQNSAHSKLTNEQALEIYNLLYNSDLSGRQIAKMYNVSEGVVSDIKLGKTYSRITGHKSSK